MAEAVAIKWKDISPSAGSYKIWPEPTARSISPDLYPTTSNDSEVYRAVFRNQDPEYDRALSTDEKYIRTGTKFDPVEEKGPWRSWNILTLDGGGVRGLSSLLILKELMETIARQEQAHVLEPATSSADSPMIETARIDEEIKKFGVRSSPEDSSRFFPCHYFDYIAGTSTGGLIAVMLGRLRMSVDSTLREYKNITSQVYQLRRRTRLRLILDHVVPTGKGTREHKIASTIKEHLEPGNPTTRKVFRSDEIRCKTIVCSLQRSSSKGALVPYLFRSYGTEQMFENGHDNDKIAAATYPITKIMLATSCSPYYFKPKKIGAYKYYDAGFSLTNPTYEVLHELNLKQNSLRTSGTHRDTNLVLSIGSGYDKTDALRERDHHGLEERDRLNRTIQQLNRALSTVSEGVHTWMTQYVETHQDCSYFRFNARSKLSVTGKGHSLKQEYELLQKEIVDATVEYLKSEQVLAELEKCASQLIEIRRLRCATNRWETFAFGSRYKCKHDGYCNQKHSGAFSSRDELIDHLRHVHKMPPADAVHGPEIKRLVDRGRTASD